MSQQQLKKKNEDLLRFLNYPFSKEPRDDNLASCDFFLVTLFIAVLNGFVLVVSLALQTAPRNDFAHHYLVLLHRAEESPFSRPCRRCCCQWYYTTPLHYESRKKAFVLVVVLYELEASRGRPTHPFGG